MIFWDLMAKFQKIVDVYNSYNYKFEQMNKLSHRAPDPNENVDLKKCKAHRTANSYGMPLNYSIKCECCGKFTQKEQLTFNFSPIKIYYCGPQLVTYLTVVKYLAILLFLLSVTNALPLMILNEKGKCCEKKLDCSPSFLLRYSIFNQFDQHKKLADESYIVIANYILCIMVWQILRNRLRKIKMEIDETDLIPSQYVVLCQLPLKNIDKNAIGECVQKWWRLQMRHNRIEMQKLFPKLFRSQVESNQDQDPNLQYSINRAIVELCTLDPIHVSEFVEQIIYSYNYSEFLDQSIVLKRQQQRKKKPSVEVSLKSQMLHGNQTLELLNRNRYCLIIFKRQDYASYFSSRNNPTLLQKLTCFQDFRYLYMNRKMVKVTNMHYPSEILWKNHHIQAQQNWRLTLKTIGIAILMIVIGSAAIFSLSLLYQRCVSLMENMLSHAYYVLVGVLINLMILIGNKIITIYCKRQTHETYVSQKMSYVYKIVFFNVFLILITPFIVFKCINTDMLWSRNGFVESEVVSLVIYMLATQIERYLSPSTLKIIRQHSKIQNERLKNLNQTEANSKFSKPSHHIHQQYAAICTIILINFFLISYTPYINILSCAWMTFQFWIEKYNISSFYNEDEFHSQLLGNKMVELIQFSFSFLIFGNLSAFIIQIQYFDQKPKLQLIILYSVLSAYCLISIFLPHEKINKRLFDLCRSSSMNVDDDFNYRNYQSIKNRFLEFYEDFNEVLCSNSNQIRDDVTKLKNKPSDQLQSISVSLSLSLKERILNNNEPIISHVQKVPENQEYFEYEKKINMKKTKPKVAIPPLFVKNKAFKTPQSSFKQTQKV